MVLNLMKKQALKKKLAQKHTAYRYKIQEIWNWVFFNQKQSPYPNIIIVCIKDYFSELENSSLIALNHEDENMCIHDYFNCDDVTLPEPITITEIHSTVMSLKRNKAQFWTALAILHGTKGTWQARL